jgi:hypothetical protein
MKSRFLCLLLAIFLCLALPLSLSGCAQDMPDVAAVYDTVVDLIERSYAANDILYGYGLPVIDIGSEYAELNYTYSANDYANYEYVSELSPYVSVVSIREMLEEVYSTEFLATYYTTLFDGFMTGDTVFPARYYETGNWLYQSVDIEPLVTWQRIYDYSTMRVIKPSSADYVTVEIDTHLEGDDTVLPVKISMVYERGGWYLDAPTY